MSYEYFIANLIVCIAPGLGVIYTLSTSLGSGLRAGLWAALGCTLATVVHLAVALAGLAAVLHTSAVLFQTIKFAGAAYLLWMAWTTLRATGTLAVDPDTRARADRPWRIVRRGVLLNLLNPKLPLFFLAFLPQFLPAGTPDPTRDLMLLGAVFVATTGGVMMTYALAAGTMRRYIVGSERAMTWLRRIFAASFAALGLRLAAERA
ncbi:LysE family translocator [Pseudooceanicola onchidii]|uniref:LysE family translocator n=1 Tax=Pseudooceanicola onchidii TaxID=2562279 RepID=UPI0010A99B91|nr:LysE family translocator [Pseudooceanicola onchidii]